MIAKDEQFIRGESPALWLFNVVAAVKVDVALGEERAVDAHPVSTDRHRLAREANHALDVWGVIAA